MTRSKVTKTMKEIADKYHFTSVDGDFKGKHFSNNLVLTSLSYLLDRNHLFIGDPGWGKTTLAQVVSSKFSGTPFDLYESLTVEGHPGLFTEKWKARPHYGELTKGKERVIWQGSFGLDTFIVDEISRVSPDVQDEMLEGIRTGRWTYMNDVLYEGKKPTFLTTNDRDNGNGDLIPPLEDRIDIVTEQNAESPFNDYRSAEKRIRENLANPEATTEALDALKQLDFARFKDVVQKSRRGDYLTQEEKSTIREEIEGLPFDNDAYYFLWTFASEINFNHKYGKKRARDPISDDDHDKKFAGNFVKGSFSARPQMAAEAYSQGLAWLLGHKKVTLDHVRYVLPYVSAHKLKFTDGFRDTHGNDFRTDYEDLHLAKELVTYVQGNYETSVKPLKDLIAKIQKGKVKPSEVNPDDYDHPLIRHIVQRKVHEPKMNI
jgi:hypothetical protein